MKLPILCLVLIILATNTVHGFTYSSSEIFEGHVYKGESAYCDISVPRNTSILFAHIMSLGDDSFSFELKDPEGTVIVDEKDKYLIFKADRPLSGIWQLRLIGQGDISNYYRGVVKVSTGKISDRAIGNVLPEEINMHQIQVKDGIGSLIMNFESLSNDDIKAALYNPLGIEIWHATSYISNQTKSEVVDFPMPGTWKVEILGSDVKESGKYELDWTQLIGIQGPSQNQDPTRLMPGSDSVNFVSDGEVKIHRFNVPPGSVHMTLGFSSLSNDDIKFTIQNPTGKEVWHSTSYGPDQTKSKSVAFPMPGNWTVEVQGVDVTRSGYYSGWIDLIEGPFSLIQTPLAQTPSAQSNSIFSDTLAGHVILDEAEENSLNVPQGTIDFHLDARSLSEDDVEILLSNPLGEEIWHATSYNSDQVKSKSVANPMPGTWMVGSFGSDVKYSGYYLVQISMKPVDLPDASSTVQMSGIISKGQIDEHIILVPEKVGLFFLLVNPSDLDLEFKLLNPSGIEVESTSSGMLKVARPLPGTWTVKVIGKDKDTESYAIRGWLVPMIAHQVGLVSYQQ